MNIGVQVRSGFLVVAVLMAGWMPARLLAQWHTFDYRSLAEAQAKLQPVSDARYLQPTLRLSGAGFARSDGAVTLTIRALQADVLIRVDGNGNFTVPLDPALQEENPQVWSSTRQDLGRLEVEPAVKVEAPPAQSFDYALVAAMREELLSSQRRGLMGRLFAPSAKALLIDFGVACSCEAQVETPGGRLRRVSAADGRLRLPLDENWMRSRAAVVLSQMPVAIRLEL